jgi:hypothetical protein
MGALRGRKPRMSKGTKIALLFGAVPFITLVLCLPIANRVRPIILGLPFLLFWILFWVLMTPLALYLASRAEKKYRDSEGEDEP